jgi:hypothetical protein
VKRALLVHRPYYEPPVGFDFRIGPITFGDLLMRKLLLAGVAALLMARSATHAMENHYNSVEITDQTLVGNYCQNQYVNESYEEGGEEKLR